MADGHGGYRRPEHPAPASGPGALSRRTDGTQPQMIAPGNGYGERKAMQEIQGGADMQGATPPVIPMGAPTMNPGEPVTAGAAAGPGIGPEAAGIQSDKQISDQQLAPLLRSLELVANLPGSNTEVRTFVRALKARLSA